MEVDVYRCHNIRGRKLFNSSPSKKAIAAHKRAALAFTTLNRPLAGESESLATSLSGGDGGDEDDGGGGGGTCVAASLATDVASAATAASATKLSKYTII
jgi:hypothetical protein